MNVIFDVILDEKAKAQLKELPKYLQQRIVDKLEVSRERPFHFFVRLKGRTDYKMRIGDYRIIADIRQNERLIVITKVGHRKDVYD
jgi:mRNA interferase RelE/StbE